MLLQGQSLDHALGVFAARVHLVDSVDVERGNVDGFRVELARFHDFLDFSDHALGGSCHVRIEVASSLVELEIAHGVCSLGLDQGEVTEDRFFFNVLGSLEDLGRFRLGNYLRLESFLCLLVFDHVSSGLDDRSHSCGSVESWDSCASSPNLFG